MIKLKDFEEIGLKITWKLLFLGYRGHPIFSNKLEINEIFNYALDVYSVNSDNDLILNLITETDNENKISLILKELSEKENTSYEIEVRKLRLIYVKNRIKIKNDNYIDGLCELSDMWIELNYPEDSPFVFQGRNNDITPKDYYTYENYNKIFMDHQIWFDKELKFIKNNQ